MNTKLIPLTRRETRVYLPNVAGGFDLAGCPDAEILAELIVKAVNAHDQLTAALREMLDQYDNSVTGIDHACAHKAREALAATEGK